MSHEWGNYPEDFTPKMYWGAGLSLYGIVAVPERHCTFCRIARALGGWMGVRGTRMRSLIGSTQRPCPS